MDAAAGDLSIRGEKIADAVAFAARRFLRWGSWHDEVLAVLRTLGEAAGASRAYIFENEQNDDQVATSVRWDWAAEGIESTSIYAANHGWPYSDGFSHWESAFRYGRAVQMRASDGVPSRDEAFMKDESVLSLIAVPIFVDSEWWGFIGFDDCVADRRWTPAEEDALHAAADTLGAAIGRERVETRLREAEQRYRALVEQIPAVLYLDQLGDEERYDRTVYVSPQVERVLGFQQAEWLADTDVWEHRLHPDDRERAMGEWYRTRDSGAPFTCEYRFMAKDGRVTWVHEEAVVLHDDEGDPAFIQGVMYDITAQKQAEDELHRALAREREATSHLRALDAMKNTLLHAVSHDLRGPLAGVIGATMLLKQDAGSLTGTERGQLLDDLDASSAKMSRLVTDLLDLDRVDRGIIEPKRIPTDVGELVRQVVDDLERDREIGPEMAGVEITILPKEPLEAQLDAARVERIIENLMRNAIRHTPTGTPVWLRAESVVGGIEIAVEDSGPGIPENLRESIFEPFTRAGEGEGAGVGLSLVARFAALHGGRAWVEDRDGGGASFRVWLPT